MTEIRKSKSDLDIIGRPQGKVDGLDKATGRAVYTDDVELPGMLHGKILRSPHAHARILSIDVSRAMGHPGVRAVVTGSDMPVQYGIIPWTPDEYPLCVDRVRYVGDGVAAVAAVDEDTAIEALKLIHVEYELLPAYLDPLEALAADGSSGAPFIHSPRKEGRNGNVTKRVRLEFGEVDPALAASDVVVEGDYFFEGTNHAAIEPHCAIGHMAEDGKLTVWSSTQVPHYLHRELAQVLDLDAGRVRVIQPLVGGAFGGKSEPFDLEFSVALLSMVTGRPVKILYTREEVFYAHRGRHPFHMRYRTGATRDGKITGVDAEILLDGGAYASFGLVTTYYSGQLLTAPYRLPAYRFDSTRVYTNKPACGPKRGHGSVQPRFAFEVQLDKLAEKLELDPIEFRRRNFMGSDTRTVNELRVTSNGFLECLDAVEQASDWKRKFRKLPSGRGVGVAGSCYISGTNYPIYPNDMPQSGVQLQVDRSGRVAVFSGASEIGQGCDSVVAYIAAEELGVPLEYVRVYRGDTDFTPVDLGAYSSRVTFMVGNACIDAARKLSRKIRTAVAEAWDCDPGEVHLRGGRAIRETDGNGNGEGHGGRAGGAGGGESMDIREAFQLAEAKYGTLGATGSYNTPKDVHGTYRGATIGASPAYSFTAHVAEVTVDEDTGFVTVDKIWVAHDCGRALNPVLVEGQMEGSAYMGFGEALMEAQVFKDGEHGKAGLHDAPSLLDYRIPTSLDTPALESHIVESLDPEGPYGAKEAGEGPLHPSIPAIANAIYDAVGVRMDRLPFSPPRVWRAIQAARGRAGGTAAVLLLALAGTMGVAGCSSPAEDPPEAPRAGEDVVAEPGGARSGELPVVALPEDWEILRGKVRWGRENGLDTLSTGAAMAKLGLTFVGTPYAAGTLELPGDESVVVNLRGLDCVTLVESVSAITELIQDPTVDPDAGTEALSQRYARALVSRRYRDGVLNGYPSRLHYFSEWIRDNQERGFLVDLTEDLGGGPDPEPVNFMSAHSQAYPKLAGNSEMVSRIRETETILSDSPRNRIPQEAIEEAAPGIRDGDIIAATSTVTGLDVAHTGLAIWVDGSLHLLHAPLAGGTVEVSESPLALRILGISGQDGIMVARPREH